MTTALVMEQHKHGKTTRRALIPTPTTYLLVDQLVMVHQNTANTAVFLCDSNGRFLNTKKMFPSSSTAQYFRCPKIKNARALIQNEIVDSPQLIVIHTGTNDLKMTHTVDDLISEITTMFTEASTKFPCSKIIYSTLLP